MEVMGLMLGEFVDDYTVRVIDVFAMPQSGTVCIFFNIKTNIIFVDLLVEKAPYDYLFLYMLIMTILQELALC